MPAAKRKRADETAKPGPIPEVIQIPPPGQVAPTKQVTSPEQIPPPEQTPASKRQCGNVRPIAGIINARPVVVKNESMAASAVKPAYLEPRPNVPRPEQSYHIKDKSSGNLITFYGGCITLSPPGTKGLVEWECTMQRGWLGFRDPNSGCFLSGRNMSETKSPKPVAGFLSCDKKKPEEGAFVVEPLEGGLFVLRQHIGFQLCPVALQEVNGRSRLRLTDADNEGSKFEFWNLRDPF